MILSNKLATEGIYPEKGKLFERMGRKFNDLNPDLQVMVAILPDKYSISYAVLCTAQLRG